MPSLTTVLVRDTQVGLKCAFVCVGMGILTGHFGLECVDDTRGNAVVVALAGLGKETENLVASLDRRKWHIWVLAIEEQ